MQVRLIRKATPKKGDLKVLCLRKRIRVQVEMRPDDPYLTPEGHAKITEEWHALRSEREEMKIQVQIAAAEGDRSENAAYTYGKMRLRQIDRRLRELDRILDKAKVVERVSDDGSIRFGARVRLQNMANQKIVEYTLVGSAEANAVEGKISTSSPLGAALIGKFVGDQVQIQTPRGPSTLCVLELNY